MTRDPQKILGSLIDAARKAGADAADALFVESVSASVSYRLGKLEDVERAESADLGLRVFVGQRVAFISSTDFSKEALAALPGRAVAMARLAPEDTFAGLAPKDRLATAIPDLDLADAAEPSAERLVELARDVEGAALAVPGVTNSEGGSASFSSSAIALATSSLAFPGLAAESPSNPTANGERLGTVVVVGTRRSDLTALESAAPVDVLSGEQLQETGAQDLSGALTALSPSFSFPQSPQGAFSGSIAQGASLRGLASDQVLVLVNGKRRHTSANVTRQGLVNGRGAAAVDLSLIPHGGHPARGNPPRRRRRPVRLGRHRRGDQHRAQGA